MRGLLDMGRWRCCEPTLGEAQTRHTRCARGLPRSNTASAAPSTLRATAVIRSHPSPHPYDNITLLQALQKPNHQPRSSRPADAPSYERCRSIAHHTVPAEISLDQEQGDAWTVVSEPSAAECHTCYKITSNHGNAKGPFHGKAAKQKKGVLPKLRKHSHGKHCMINDLRRPMTAAKN
ncbi:hypothetical protein CC80DRAFT_21593 [Byssothecium circinans]|uniref:Uncharacterized protein n=1 Tax=Byssothecium circinans TaxID=147558 RepID=A0A6A5U4J2_9PLEO|nr:hypothetical protein CC80DRAFT_21593 [Byssothecium circinans]